KRHNQILRKSEEEKLVSTVKASLTQHACRKNGAQRENDAVLDKLKGLSLEQKNQFKQKKLQDMLQLEIKAKKLLKERANLNDADVKKQVEQEPTTLNYYNYLCTHALNGKERKTASEHLNDVQFAKYITSLMLGHSRLDVIASYVFEKK